MNQICDPTISFQSPMKLRDRSSNSTIVSQDYNQIQDMISSLEFEFENLKFSPITYFQPQISQPQITSKLHKKAVHALFSICWDKNIDEEALWCSLMIYYSYKSKKMLKKVQLDKVVTVSILISTKLFCPGKITINEIISITNNKYTAKSLFQIEQEILNTLNYDLCMDSLLTQNISLNYLEQTQKSQLFCLAQLLMIKNSDIFWKKNISKSLINYIKGVSNKNFNDLKKNLLELSVTKEGEIVLRKYSSKVNTDKLLQNLSKG